MFTYFDTFSIEDLDCSSSFRISFKKKNYDPHNTCTIIFVNTQLPDILIDLPQSITADNGSFVILPTIEGEYQSGGKTWRPVSWNIGAFGDSYTLISDVTAYLVFEEVEEQEIVEEHTGYAGQIHSDNYSIQSGFWVRDENNNTIPYDDNKIYTFVALYMANGQEPDNYTKANCRIVGKPESQGNPNKVYAVIDHTGFQTTGCYCIYTTQNV